MRKYILAIMFFIYFLSLNNAMAGLILSATRVVYNSSAREVTLTVNNDGSRPAVMQVWLDVGDPKIIPNSSDIPFFLTPGFVRVEKNKSQSIRILKTLDAERLPKDKESIFYLNVLDIPPQEKNKAKDEGGRLQFSVRSRIKLFYRPLGLSGSANDAPNKIKFFSNGEHILVKNSSPYYVNIQNINIGTKNKKKADKPVLMIPPMSEGKFNKTSSKGQKIYYQSVNDLGGVYDLEGLIL